MTADGSEPIILTNNRARDWYPTWSPDGKKIAFVSDRDGNDEVYAMNADGTGQINLTESNGRDYAPAWSPVLRNPVIEHPDCTSGWTRLTAGGKARVSGASTTPNRVRTGPTTAEAIIAVLYPGSVLELLEGPICAEGLVFWKVESTLIAGGVGWTAEGDLYAYYLEPHGP